MMKTLGILGGMGPLAGAYFYGRVIANTLAEGDCDHIPVLLLSDPAIPDRTAHLLHGGASPLPALCAALQRLSGMGAEVLAIPCNTAHVYLPALRIGCCTPILDMPRLAVQHIFDSGAESFGLLSTRGTLASGIYRDEADKRGISTIELPPNAAAEVEELIYLIKAGICPEKERFIPYIEALHRAGADVVLLACTELSAILRGEAGPRTADALEVLAKAAVQAVQEGEDKEMSNGEVLRAFA